MNYFIWTAGEQHGPYTFDQLQAMCSAGMDIADVRYWREEMNDWGELAELMSTSSNQFRDASSSAGEAEPPPFPDAFVREVKPPPPWPNAMPVVTGLQSFKPKNRTLLFVLAGLAVTFSAFVLLLVVATLLFFSGSTDPSSPTSAAPVLTPNIEQQLAARLQESLQNQKQQIFDRFHPAGKAKRIVVDDIHITWKDGRVSGEPRDIQACEAIVTLFWEGVAITNGHTRLRLACDAGDDDDSWELIDTNGTTNDDIKSGVVSIAGDLFLTWLKGKVSSSGEMSGSPVGNNSTDGTIYGSGYYRP